MKSINTLAVAAVLALTGADLASAQETVYHVAGASSFRVALISAEVAYLNGVTSTGTVTGAYAGTSGLTGNNVSLVETPTASGTVVFENNLSGSIAGVEGLNGIGTQIAFPTDTGVTLSPVTPGSSSVAATGGTANVTFSAANGNTQTTDPDLAFSDDTLATASAVIDLAVSGASLSGTEAPGVVGVVPYVFVANATTDVTDFGSTQRLTNGSVVYATSTVTVNVNPQNFARLWSAGSITTAARHPEIFTGNPADTAYKIYAIGRDIDSGTRASTLAETGYALAGNGAAAVTANVIQFYPQDASSNVVGNVSSINPIASFETVPAETVDGISLAAGDGGYNSGSSEGKALSATFSSSLSHAIEIGYLGASDGYSALTASGTNRQPGILLGYNGSTFNPAGSSTTQGFATQADINKVYTGQYTFWSYEHLFFAPNNANGNGLNDSTDPTPVVSALYTQLHANNLELLSSAGVIEANLLVSRSDDGLLVK
jgi:hypothetical protein